MKHIYGDDHDLIGKFVHLESGELALVYGSYTIPEMGKMLAVLVRWKGGRRDGTIAGMSGVSIDSVIPLADCRNLRMLAHEFLAEIADQRLRPTAEATA